MTAILSYEIKRCEFSVVKSLCESYHGYAGAGGAATYCFAVYESGIAIAAFSWLPPPPGAARSVCPECPEGVLSLSRMVAVEKCDRKLNHISKPLRKQMKSLIDRTRWPVLVTYHDEGQGHNGHVYKCSGWKRTREGETRTFRVDEEGRRRSTYSNGKTSTQRFRIGGTTKIHRWEHWACEPGQVSDFMAKNGWVRVLIDGKFWKSGSQAYRFENQGILDDV